jgi:hypothetical protein
MRFVSGFKYGSCWNGLNSDFKVLSVGEFVFAMLVRKIVSTVPLFIRQVAGSEETGDYHPELSE